MSPGDTRDGDVVDGDEARRSGRRGRRGRAAVAAPAPRPFPDGSTFLRGLSIGALVGAAIAGSTIWERRHRRRRPVGASGDRAEADDRLRSGGSPEV